MRWLKRGLIAGLIALAIIYGGFVGALYFRQRAILYPIPQTQRTLPKAAGLPQAEEHILTTSDGEKVIVWHVPPQANHPVVIFFHGNGETLAWRVPRFRALVSDGTGLVALSYRGYAGSTGAPTERGLLSDGAATYIFAAAHYAPDRLMLWGFSLGSGVAVAVAAEKPIGKLILEAPFTSIIDVASLWFPFVPISLAMRDQFHSDRRIGSVAAPLLVMHGEHDQAISIRLGEKLYALAHEPKEFVRFLGARHENLDRYGAVETVQKFINTPSKQTAGGERRP
jgi:hypothetical protein